MAAKRSAAKQGAILSVAVLNKLGPGQRFRYYRGDFHRDITRAEEKDRRGDSTVNYAMVLKSVRDTARSLALDGRITLTEEQVNVHLPGAGPVTMTDYIAVGL